MESRDSKEIEYISQRESLRDQLFKTPELSTWMENFGMLTQRLNNAKRDLEKLHETIDVAGLFSSDKIPMSEEDIRLGLEKIKPIKDKKEEIENLQNELKNLVIVIFEYFRKVVKDQVVAEAEKYSEFFEMWEARLPSKGAIENVGVFKSIPSMNVVDDIKIHQFVEEVIKLKFPSVIRIMDDYTITNPQPRHVEINFDLLSVE